MDAKALAVRGQIIGCRSCGLSTIARRPIPWSGSQPNAVAVIGEAPGAQEDEAGVPFCGPSGSLLRATINLVAGDDVASGFSYLNAVSCYPRRTPHISEVEKCKVNRDAQLELIEPRYLLVVGGVALQSFYPKSRMGESHGKWWKWELEARKEYDRPFVWCYGIWHPSAVMRSGGLKSRIGLEFKQDLTMWWMFVSRDMKVTPPDSRRIDA